MERVYRDGRKEILAQFGNECDYVGDARCLPESASSKPTASETPGAVRSLPVCFLYLTDTDRTQTFVAGGTSSLSQYSQPRDRDRDRDRDEYSLPERVGGDRQIGYGGGDNARNALPANSQTDPEYSSFEEAEAAFMKLLKRVGVQPEWTWEQTVRAAVKDPQYRALKDPKDRKAAFEKFVIEVRAQEKDKEKERLAKLRSDFASMLRSHPEIKHYTRWKTARPIIEKETIFRSAKTDDERRQLFEEYIIELKKTHAENETSNRKAAMDELISILNALDLEPYTRWSKAQEIIQSNERFSGDEKFKSLTKLDILKAFENHIKSLERSFNDTRQKQKHLKARRERQNRDQFLALLKDLKSAGKIKAGTKWMDIHPLIEDDPRYVAMLGQSGSTPLDLFWDNVEEEERALRGKRGEVLDVLDVSLSFAIAEIIHANFLIGQTLRNHNKDYFRRLPVCDAR